MKGAEIRQLDIKLIIDGERRHPTEISASMSVNSYPIVQVTHHINIPAEKSAIDMTSQDACMEMGVRQKKVFSEEQAQASLTIKDGQGGQISFSGVCMGSSYAFAPWAVDLKDTLLPEYAAMDNLNYACYGTTYELPQVHQLQQVTLEKAGSVPKMFVQVGDALRTKWQDAEKPDESSNPTLQRATAEKQDATNQKLKKYFQELMEASSDTFGWDDLKDWLKTTSGKVNDDGIRTDLSKILQDNSGSFLSNICRFAELFQCLYVPKWDEVGYLINRSKLLDEPETYKAEIISLNLNTGGRGMLPVRYIAVTGASSTGAHQNGSTSVYLVYPESAVANGSMIPKAPPTWMPKDSIAVEIEKSGESERKLALKIKGIKNKAEKRTKELEKARKGTKDILQEWAKCCYIWEALGNTSAQITVPLDLSVEVGKRYTVKNNKGQYLFEGFLRAVTHNIKSAPGHSGSCTSSLTFTHIYLPGFTLPEE